MGDPKRCPLDMVALGHQTFCGKMLVCARVRVCARVSVTGSSSLGNGLTRARQGGF